MLLNLFTLHHVPLTIPLPAYVACTCAQLQAGGSGLVLLNMPEQCVFHWTGGDEATEGAAAGVRRSDAQAFVRRFKEGSLAAVALH